ncbi:MAG TPA: BatA and WFA domain-containing protein [Gemmataceae bacterium]|nr:BatA and WFA domain-containing protein [Gemmataceae bacterium]
MSLANPSALFWLALAIPVVVFYILKIRLKRVPVSTVIFWRQIFDEKKPRSLWQRLRHLVSLLVQLLLLTLLIAALTEPFLASEARNARRIILVIDNSASMTAADVAPNRLAKAKEEAHALIRGLRARDEMAIVVAGTQPRVVCGLTGHQKTLRGFVDEVGPTDGPTKLAEAIATARRLAAESDGGKESKIVVVTDGCAEDAAKLSEGEGVKFILVGTKAANVGVTRLQVRRSTIDPIGYEIMIEVQNFSDAPAKPRLNLTLNGNTVDVIPLDLPPGEKWGKVVTQRTAEGGLLLAELVEKGEKGDVPYPDGLATDNKAYAVLPRRDKVDTHMYSPVGNLFLQKVLEANPLTELKTTRNLPKEFGAEPVKVFHREVPAKLPPGQILVVDPTTDCDLWKVGDKLVNPLVTQQEKDSPFMAHVRLDNVLMPEAKKLNFTPAAGKPQVLAGAVSGDPLYVLIDRPEGRVVVLTVNLDLGDLPFRTAFPILALNAIGVFTSTAGEIREALPTGATAETTLPQSGEYVLRDPDGVAKKLPSGGGKVTIGPFDKCGVWAVAPEGEKKMPIDEYAVNLMSRAESDLRPPEGITASASVADAGLVSGFLGRPIWWYLIGLAVLLAAVEWYLYQRRWIS